MRGFLSHVSIFTLKVACALTLALPVVASASDLFDWKNSSAQASLSQQPIFAKVKNKGQQFSLNVKSVNALQLGDSFTLNLPNNENYQAKITKVTTNKNGIKHIKAQITSKQLPIIITLGKSQFFIRVVTPNEVLVAQGMENFGYLLNEARLHSDNKNLSEKDYKIPNTPVNKNNSSNEDLAEPHERSSHHQQFQNNRLSVKGQVSAETATVDVLFVYSLTAEALYNGDITTRLAHLIEVTNQIYLDSNIDMQIDIADTLAVDYSDESMSDQALDDITFNQHEVFANIESLRFEKGADMVALLRPYIDGDSACGLAWANSSITSSVNYMYSHTSIDCGDYVLGHELGHNMGLAHSRAQGDVGYSFPYAIGHRVQDAINGFATVMAYSASNASKVYKFSNPDILCSELPCGVDRTDPVNGADARFALNQVRFQLENLMDKDPDLTLASDALVNIVDANLKSCLDNQVTGNNITYASQVRYINCSYRNITNLTGIDSFKNINTAYLSGNNLNDLSPLSSLTKLATLSLSNSQINDTSALANLINLNELYIDNNTITDISALSQLSFLKFLWANNNNITDISALSNLTLLVNINLSYNQITSLSALANLTSLTTLTADSNNISELGDLSDLSLLTRVSLSDNNLTDISSLAQVPNLMNLNLHSNSLTSIDVLKAVNSLISLNVSNNQISAVSNLSELNKLTDLRLNSNQLTSVNFIANNTSLNVLNVSTNNIDNISAIGQLSQITDLNISYNPLTSLSPLSMNDGLMTLDISGTEINDISPITHFHHMQSLSLDNTPVTNIETVSTLLQLNTLSMLNTDIADISAMFDLHNQWFNLNFLLSTKIYCWQIDYLKAFLSFYELTEPNSCSTAQNSADFDNDGISNQTELQNNTNPVFHNEQAGTLSLQLDAITVEEKAQTLTFKVIRQTGDMGEVSVDVNTLSSTATQGDDFTGLSTTLTFPAGVLSSTFSVDIIDDTHFDNNEVFTIELSNSQSATLGEHSALTVTIADNDAVAFNWASTYQEVLENANTLTVTVTRPNNATGEMSVDVTALDFSATNGVDYTFSDQTLVFADSEFSKDVVVDIIDNDNYQENRSFYLQLTNPVDAIVDEKSNSLLIEIIENETPPKGVITFETNRYSADEADNELILTLLRIDGSFGDITVDYTVTNGSAVQGEDFTLTDGQITFLDGEREKNITVTITDDSTDESNEEFTVTITSAEPADIGVINVTTITINDNDETVIVTPPPTNPPPTQNNSSSGGGGSMSFLLSLLFMQLALRRLKIAKRSQS